MFRLSIVFLLSFMISQKSVYACNVCHSKNPKMVKMHKVLEDRSCFTCHRLEKREVLKN